VNQGWQPHDGARIEKLPSAGQAVHGLSEVLRQCPAEVARGVLSHPLDADVDR